MKIWAGYGGIVKGQGHTVKPVFIEVRDSRTGYFIPALCGTGLRPDGGVVRTPPPPPPLLSLGNSGRHSGQEITIRGFPKVLGSC